MPGSRLQALERVAERISSILMYVSMGMLLFMMFLGSADVLGRYLFNKPVVGSFEIHEILLPGIVFFGLAYTQLVKGHVSIELVYARLARRLRAEVSVVTSSSLVCLFALIAWRGVVTAISYLERHREVTNLGWPFYPFQLFVPLGALAICLVLIVDVLHSISEIRKAG